MHRLLTAVTKTLGMTRTWRGRRISEITPQMRWGFVDPEGDSTFDGAEAETDVTSDPDQIELAMLKYAGQTTKSFEGWAVETYRHIGAQFCRSGADFIKLDLTAPPLSRALTEHSATLFDAGLTPQLEIGDMSCSVKSFTLEEGAADVESKVLGFWTPRELSYHMQAGADGPEAAYTSTRFELEKIVLEVEFSGHEAFFTGAHNEPTVQKTLVNDRLQALQHELRDLREQMSQGKLTADQRPRLAEIGQLIREEQCQPTVDTPQPRSLVTHAWTFETDTPRLSKGQLPVWRASNINNALDVEVGRRRQPQIA
eukprot:m.120528 g.120528  ORF g.120528 m.120528 type:complete len:312 (-) comp13346_c0_seq5:711-1646(-)